MPVLGIGVDILHLGRFSDLLLRRSSRQLAKRILSRDEWNEWNKMAQENDSAKMKFLASRWATKEAAYKALFPVHKLTWKDVVLSRSLAYPKPVLTFSAESKIQVPRALKFHTSISHDGDYLIAQVLAEVATDPRSPD